MINDECGDAFFQGTKYTREELPRKSLNVNEKPDDFKIYENRERVALPTEHDFLLNDLKHVLVERRSRRRFSPEPMALQELSTLLKFSAGLSNEEGAEFSDSGFKLRHVPSAGGLYPYETYVIAHNVEGLNRGLYHYHVPGHALDVLKEGDFRKDAAGICLDQFLARDCAAMLAWTLVAPRSKWKYGERAYRYIFLDLGHLAQNFYLVAEVLQLSACAIGALYDDEGNDFLEVDGYDESLCYVGVVGRRA
ncbi:MAG TPA: SagB/ThcOx family dehydrogenase [Candidatus Lokiarchaeia archaeon]|nr:SagB/ThcOx family dehydrogenase [Candidatus Lokiarchaeia archaeon]